MSTNTDTQKSTVSPVESPKVHPLVMLAKNASTADEARTVIYELAKLKPARKSFDGMTKEERKIAMAEGKKADAAYALIANPAIEALRDSGLVDREDTKRRAAVLKSGEITLTETNVKRIGGGFATAKA